MIAVQSHPKNFKNSRLIIYKNKQLQLVTRDKVIIIKLS